MRTYPSHPASLDNIDIAKVLSELGLTNLRPKRLWEPTTVGDITVTLTPFHGAGLGPSSPADWCTVHARLGEVSTFLATNACRDQTGSMEAVVRQIRDRLGAPTVLFSSYIEEQLPLVWFTRRPFYFGAGREQGTTNVTDAVRWYTLLGADLLVPYGSFAWTRDDFFRPSMRERPYGGVARSGRVQDLAKHLALWPRGGLLPLAAGESLSWRRGEAVSPRLNISSGTSPGSDADTPITAAARLETIQ